MEKLPVALRRYLSRHIEDDLPSAGSTERWQNVLVIPAYRESAALVQRLKAVPPGHGRTVIIVVLNRPAADKNPAANDPLRQALLSLPPAQPSGDLAALRQVNDTTDLYLHDMEQSGGTTETDKGVGLARKTGCDIALTWQAQGALSTHWLHCTDADAILPADYFEQTRALNKEAVAAVYPFTHLASSDERCTVATALYELRMHHYVLGLRYAGSPYAHHSLGSCIAVKTLAYAQVRGFPPRAAGEDFYLLGKLAKIGPVNNTRGQPISIESRLSDRVPFGTGPATARIAGSDTPLGEALFYHPHCFEALRALIGAMPSLQDTASRNFDLGNLLEGHGLPPTLAQHSARVLKEAGIDRALSHCQRQSRSTAAFTRHFNQWFDALRTLRFIHGLRNAGWEDQTLAALELISPRFIGLQDEHSWDLTHLREACVRQLAQNC
tara:strand:+ start:78430 stop:79746 length:1317 start_codon:yes stop_codon:yes gene_type:complete